MAAELEELWSGEFCGGQLYRFRLEGERLVRVWTPPGWTLGSACMALWLNDGQNLFGDIKDSFGGDWGVAGTVAHLMGAGAIQPVVVIGIDHAGTQRSFDYLPVPPTGWDAPWGKGMRGDMALAPGGGVDAYIDRVIQQLLPWAEKRFGLADSPASRIFGGSSFGGICALYMAMKYPKHWSGVLVESPSFWAGNGRFMADVASHTEWPQMMFVAMGELEYTGFRGTDRPGSLECDAFLRDACRECVAHLEKHGLGSDRLVWFIEPGGKHNERDWGRRLPAVLRWFLAKPPAEVLQESETSFVTRPSPILPGAPFEFYAKKAKLKLGDGQGLKVHLGFNGWTQAIQTCDLMPACLSSVECGREWLAACACAPPGAVDMSFAFTNGDAWDNNGERNYDLPVGSA
eukprot:TRINITY_DN80748_c0_g1_i1.p1 TRINITY_DN80748_c0_g1~~TRINITY_DN80748_c0_g1_i1.p1  ORF type:complete len:414 (+),score=80.38 TRINITY_DN80748_c0_g1_i1:37-1242(+)